MKLFISLIFILVSLRSEASFINIYHSNNHAQAYKVKEGFLNIYNIPTYWISIIEKNDSCELKRKSKIMDICINKKGELIRLSNNRHQINGLNILKKGLNND